MEPTEGKDPDRGAFLRLFLQMEDDMKTKTNSPLEPLKFLLTIHKNVGMISGRRERNPFRQREGGTPSWWQNWDSAVCPGKLRFSER